MRIVMMAVLGLAPLAPASAAEISGVVTHVEDGDTFSVGVTAIRLCGIDAPESRAPGGDDSFAALYRMIRGRQVRCLPVGEGTPCDGRSQRMNRGRVVAQCFLEGADIAAAMVRAGFACDWPRYSGGAYGPLGCTRR